MRNNKKIAVAALAITFSIVALKLTDSENKYAFKVHQGRIFMENKGYCDSNGSCILGEDLSEKERNLRAQVAWSALYAPDGAFLEQSPGDSLWLPAIEESIASYEAKNKPLNTPPLYQTTIERVQAYLSQGLTLVAGETAEGLAKKVDALNVEMKKADASGVLTEETLNVLEQKEKRILSLFVFDGPAKKKVDSLLQLIGADNPEQFTTPSDLSINAVKKMIKNGQSLAHGISINSLARELDFIKAGKYSITQSAIIGTRFMDENSGQQSSFNDQLELRVNNIVSRAPAALVDHGSDGTGHSIEDKGFTKADVKKIARGTVEFGAKTAAKFLIKKIGGGYTGMAIDLSFGKLGHEDVLDPSTGGIPDNATKEERDAYQELYYMARGIAEKEAAEKSRKESNDRAWGAIHRAKTTGNQEMGEGSGTQQASGGNQAPTKTYVDRASQGTTKDKTVSGAINDAMQDITGQLATSKDSELQIAPLPAPPVSTGGSSGGDSNDIKQYRDDVRPFNRGQREIKSGGGVIDTGSNYKHGTSINLIPYKYRRVSLRIAVLS